jgi:hypothetical protein
MPVDSANAYNAKALEADEIKPWHISRLTLAWQIAKGIEPVDGKLGPITRESLEVSPTPPEPGDDPGLAIMLLGLELAELELGKGEDPALGNNRGADVDRYRSEDGTGMGPGGAGPWCASFAASRHVVAAGNLELEMGCRTSRNAKRYCDLMTAGGRPLDEPEPGCIVVWHRGARGTWGRSRKGHIGLCVSYDPSMDTLITIEGNKTQRGQRFAKVARFAYRAGSWRSGLYGLATLAA